MKKMTLNEAILILMECARRDVTGSGGGYRSTTNKWREKAKGAWRVAFRWVYKREPEWSDLFNAKMG